MAGMFGHVGKKITRLDSLNVQTSVYGIGIPVFWGQARLSGNVLDYVDFKANKASAGKGGISGGGKGSSYTYSAAAIIGICEGPIQSILQVYENTTANVALSTLGLTAFLGTYTQVPWSYMITNHSSNAQNYRGVAYVAGNVNLGQAATLPNYGYECLSTFNGAIGGAPDANPKDVISDALTNQYYGIGFPTAWIGDLDTASTYCLATGMVVSPKVSGQNPARDFFSTFIEGINCDARISSGKLDILPYGQTDVTGNGSTYTAPATAQYSLFDSDFIATNAEDNPIRVIRKKPQDAKNTVQVSYSDRVNNYNMVTLRFFDDAAIQQYGRLEASPVSYDFFCLQSAAQTAGGLALWRQQFRNEYQFRIGRRFQRLDCLDIISLTHAAQGLNNQWVQITDIQEETDGTFTIRANEYLGGTSSPPTYGSSTNTSFVANFNASAGNVNTPAIFTAPKQIATNNGYEAWIVTGSSAANFGGYDVYVSSDGTNYRFLGEFLGNGTQGLLTAALNGGSDPDVTNTLSVNLSETAGTLNSGTQADADNNRLLCYVDGELISYETATLTGVNRYDLTYLRRGVYGTPIGAHSIGTIFAYLQNNTGVFRFPFSKDQIGSTVYIKICSFNNYRGGQQDLGSVSAYTYVIGSPPAPVGVANLVLASAIATASDGSVQPIVTLSFTPPTDPAVTQVEVQYRQQGGGTTIQTVVSNNPVAGFLAVQAGILSASPMEFRARYLTEDGVASAWTSWLPVTTAQYILANSTTKQLANHEATLKQVLTQQASLSQSVIQSLSAAQAAIINTTGAWQQSILTTVNNGLVAQASQTSVLSAVLDGILGSSEIGLAASVASLQTAVANLQTGKADASNLTDLNAQINTPTTGLAAQVTVLQSTVASLDPTGVNSLVQTTLTSVTALQNQFSQLGQSVIQAIAAMLSTQQQIQASAAYATETLHTNVQGNISALAESQAEIGAFLSDGITTLSATVSSNYSVLVTSISAETTRATSQESILQNNINTVSASITTESTTRATADSAQAASITNINAILTGYSSGSTVQAAITSEQSARVTGDSANASSITTLSTTLGGHTTSITAIQSVLNGLSAYWGVSLNVNGAITGLISLSNSGSTSSFVVAADQFTVYTSGGNTAPFQVTGGAVYVNVPLVAGLITANMIHAGTITADRISAATITDAQIASGGVTTGNLATAAATTHVHATATGPIIEPVGQLNNWNDLVSLTITTAGSPVELQAIAVVNNTDTGSHNYSIRIMRDDLGAAIWPVTQEAKVPIPNTQTLLYPAIWVDNPDAGTYTYRFQFKTDSFSVSAYNVVLTADEIKR